MSSPQVLLTTKRFRVEQVEQRLADASVHTRAVVRHPGAVTILPLLDHDRVCLIRNYRVSVEKSLIEFPAGTLEPDEEPAATAARELIEETGYRAGRIEWLSSFYLSPGILDERMWLYVAHDLEWVGAAREAGEQIENLIVTWQEALDLVDSGQIEDAKTLVALLHYDRIRRANAAPS